MSLPFYRPTIAIIDLDAITNNVSMFQNMLNQTVEIMAVVKADAYGHGAIPVVKHLQSLGVHYFAVAFLDEAIQLRKAGVRDNILVLGYTPLTGIEDAYKYDLTLTVFTNEVIEHIDIIGKKLGKKLKVHIKVDTGMGRIGISPDEFEEFYQLIDSKQWIAIDGVFTHFATADEKDKTFTLKQYQSFAKAVNKVGSNIPVIHLSNSAAIIDLPNDINQNMARLGIGLYGLLPSDEVNLTYENLKPAMSLKTEISFLKKIKPGATVSYGATFKATRETVVATLPIGYADGLPRGLSNKGYFLVHGKRAPIIGRICMDQTMIDVTDIEDVMMGDEVIIFGTVNQSFLSIDEHAYLLDTINYELVTQIGQRVPRIYKKNGKIVDVANSLLTR